MDGDEIADAGFVGNGKVILYGVVQVGPSISWVGGIGKGLFHGTGAFEGQTLNFNSNWRLFGGGIVWDGYLLKP